MVRIFVHLDEPEAKVKKKIKVARPVHKVVAKDMGQKNKEDRPRTSKNVYKRRLAVTVQGIGQCRQVNKA